MSDKITLPLTAKVSELNGHIEVNYKSLFTTLSKAVGKGISQNWVGVAMDMVGVFDAVKYRDHPGKLAWALIYNSLNRALIGLVSENIDLYFDNKPDKVKALGSKLIENLDNCEIVLDSSFLSAPGNLPILEEIKPPFRKWLQNHGLNKAKAASVSERLNSYFVYTLASEWQSDPTKHRTILDALKMPFSDALENELTWKAYAAFLERQVNEPMFDEKFGLKQVYIPLRAYHLESNEKKSDKDDEFREIQHDDFKKVAIDLKDHLISWLGNSDKKDPIRVISGGPGSGKSSFAKMFAADVSSEGCKAIYVPLHVFNPEGGLEGSLQNFLQRSGLLRIRNHNPLNENNKLLLIFDGLDELASQGKLGENTARDFVRKVREELTIRNTDKLKLKVIITGRDVAVQGIKDTMYDPYRPLVQLLPYFVTSEEKSKYIDKNSILKEDQRDKWWFKYGLATGEDDEKLPVELRFEKLDELTAQPLLNYMIALVRKREDFEINTDTNLNQIYRKLITDIYERTYEGRRHRVIEEHELTEDKFVRILEEIALCTWHGDGRTTTVKEIEKHCEALKTGQLFESFKVGLQSGVAKLFTAFYFREHNRRDTGDQAFEFTHKSFGEYLTGLRIMRAVETIQDEFDRHAKDMDKGWNEREALKHLAIVCGPTPMETYMLDYIRNEVKDRNESSVKKWQTTFGKLIKYVIEKDMPMEMTDLNKFADMRLQAINTEQALFVILNACNLQLKESFNIDIPNRDLLSNWIKRLLLVSGDTMKKCFSYLDLSHTNFTGSDFNKGDLQEVNFSDANLSRTNLRDADLSGSDLRRAYTRGSDLDGAKLNRADIYPRR